jgi:hypothetical protein
MQTKNLFMKKACLLMFNLMCVFSYSQTELNSSKNHVPNILPPSPTVAGLMKFEEIPVSNYTGVPNISVPLFSTNSYFGLNIDLNFSYHTSSVKKNDVASSSGLGWSLIAGGTISRTVMGIPDDYYESASGKCGIYHSTNNFYSVLNLLTTNNLNHQDFVKNYETNKLMFNANEKQIYDIKHDLYQYNFMGKSGRFIIKKVISGFEIVKFDFNNLKIEYFDNVNNKHFEITDEQGFKYKFDILETSRSSNASLSTYIDNNVSTNLSFNYEYISAFHISEVRKDNVVLATFEYTGSSASEDFKEGARIGATVFNQIQGRELQIKSFFHNNDNYTTAVGVVQPSYSLSFNNVITNARKLKKIHIPYKANVFLNYVKGSRNDLNLLSLNNSVHLSSILIQDINGVQIKKYNFEYDFGDKLFLTGIQESTTSNEHIKKYEFEYDRNWLDPTQFDTDFWGYYKTRDCNSFTGRKEVDKSTLTKDALLSIKYPTGGSTRFYYETNTYAYVGDVLIQDNSSNNGIPSFDENPDNFTYEVLGNVIPAVNYDREIEIFVDRHICTEFVNEYQSTGGVLSLIKRTIDGDFVESTGLGATIVDENHSYLCDKIKLTIEAGYKYNIQYTWLITGIFENPCPTIPLSQQPFVSIKSKIRNNQTIQQLNGGGFRISKINYLRNGSDDTDPQNIIKTTLFNYNHPEATLINQRSSGSLVFQKPAYEYFINRRFKRQMFRGCNDDIGNIGGGNSTYSTIYDPLISYKVITDFDNVSTITTQGSHVGYQYVKVFEKHNGVTEYTYTSPIDYPEYPNYLAVQYPFVSLPNRDFKRGLVKKVVVKDQTDKVLTETLNEYNFTEQTIFTGFTTYYKDYDCPHTSSFDSYTNYFNSMGNAIQSIANALNITPQEIRDNPSIATSSIQFVTSGNQNLVNCICCGVDAKDFIDIYYNKEIMGISQQTKSTVKNYFYVNGVANIIQNETLLFYNSNNYQISKKIFSDNATNIETRIYYPGDFEVSEFPFINQFILKNMVTVPLKTDIYRNNLFLNSEKIFYKHNTTNHQLLPDFVYTKKGGSTQNDETNINFKLYDNYGNILEYETLNNSMNTSIIWGYNHTQPVAKIENMAYNSIPENLRIAINNATTESTLNLALNNLRSSPALANAMITTYVYKPLVGVTKITDPKGDEIYYEYDAFNRLKTVKDKNGKLLSENDYHYRTQQQSQP